MRLKPLAYAVAWCFPPDIRYGPNAGCPFCGIMYGHLEGCSSPNAGMSGLPRFPRMKFHEFNHETWACERCGTTPELVHATELRPIYGDREIKPCISSA